MRRRVFAGLVLLPMVGCAGVAPFAPTPAGRYAALATEADRAIGQIIDHLAARERIEVDQAASLRYAAAATLPRALPPPVTPMAGAVLDPGMDLVVIDAQRLAALAGGVAAGGDAQAAAALARLDAALDRLAVLGGAPAGRWRIGAGGGKRPWRASLPSPGPAILRCRIRGQHADHLPGRRHGGAGL